MIGSIKQGCRVAQWKPPEPLQSGKSRVTEGAYEHPWCGKRKGAK